MQMRVTRDQVCRCYTHQDFRQASSWMQLCRAPPDWQRSCQRRSDKLRTGKGSSAKGLHRAAQPAALLLSAILRPTSWMLTEKLKAASNTSKIKGTAFPWLYAVGPYARERKLCIQKCVLMCSWCSFILFDFGTLKTFKQVYHQEVMDQVRLPTWSSSPGTWWLQQGRKEASFTALPMSCTPALAALLTNAIAVT